MDYTGVIIEESLKDSSTIKAFEIINTKIEPITEQHKTPRLKQWTLHIVKVPINEAEAKAQLLSQALADNYWYADFKNKSAHYIIFPHQIFKIDRTKAKEYEAATKYGLALGIPDYQLDFAPNVVEWERPKK